MNPVIDAVAYAMQTYCLEEHTDGSFFIQNGYTEEVVRTGLTAGDEPTDIVDEMNARAAIDAIEKAAWTPMDSAPMDKTVVWLYMPKGDDPAWTTAGWHDERGWRGLDGMGNRSVTPTRWRPLPELPQA